MERARDDRTMKIGQFRGLGRTRVGWRAGKDLQSPHRKGYGEGGWSKNGFRR